jgi:TRAP-type mannitol/chloroaromatic compound transport system substrate-binding protein
MARTFLGEGMSYEDRILLAQLTQLPGWKILVRLMAEACRLATEDVIKLDPATDRYPEKVAALQTNARAMNKFSGEILDSVKVHQRSAVAEAQAREKSGTADAAVAGHFTGFKMPQPKPQQSPEAEKK